MFKTQKYLNWDAKTTILILSFFISFSTAEGDKPASESKKPPAATNNLLIAAKQQANDESNDNADQDGYEGEGASSDGDTADILRKKEIIMARQLERRQKQELIRLKREEEKARKAEEMRLKEDELNNKKMLEKTRKEIIYQAYIEKKKQLEEESQCGAFGPPNSLLHAKKFHSTYRLKTQQPPKMSANNLDQQQQQFKQNMIDQFDQASIYSDRSSNQPYAQQGMIKSKWNFWVSFSFGYLWFCVLFFLFLLRVKHLLGASKFLYVSFEKIFISLLIRLISDEISEHIWIQSKKTGGRHF